MVKDARLDPPIPYELPEGYKLVLEPVNHFSKVIDSSIYTKFSVINTESNVYIRIDEDLTNTLTSDSTIIYKLKVSKSIYLKRDNCLKRRVKISL